jgi:hypothetical protein
MCVQCAFDASKAAASSGGAVGVPALLAAASAALGLKKLSVWLVAHDVRLLTARRLKIVTPIAVWVTIIALYSVRL